jgi:hypothetical protein
MAAGTGRPNLQTSAARRHSLHRKVEPHKPPLPFFIMAIEKPTIAPKAPAARIAAITAVVSPRSPGSNTTAPGVRQTPQASPVTAPQTAKRAFDGTFIFASEVPRLPLRDVPNAEHEPPEPAATGPRL